MWTEVFMSQNRLKVDEIIEALEGQHIMTMLRTAGEDDFSAAVTYTVMVPQTELESAQEIIFEAEISIK